MHGSRLLGLLGVALTLALTVPAGAAALSLQPVGAGFDQPVYVTSDPSDAGRLFVAERKGTIRLVENGTTSLFTDLSAAVGCGGSCAGERGLMSIAAAPDFESSGLLYVDYANDIDGTIHVARVEAAPDGRSADPATLEPLLAIPHGESTMHNGGQIQFGSDGALYVSTGDGGGSNDQFHHAQDPGDPLGKILRLVPSLAPAYTIWSSGLRNPYRFSFDALSGDLTIGDVGQALSEEIDFLPSPTPGLPGGEGANFGWNCREGFALGAATDPECATFPAADFVQPVFDYPHTPDPDLGGADRCAVIGGYVVRDAALGRLYGRYLYADLCSGALRALRLPAASPGLASRDCSLDVRLDNPVSFGEDAARRLYAVEQGGGVYRIAGLPPAGCPPPEPTGPPIPPPLDPPTAAPPARTGSFVGIHARRRRVEPGARALLTVFVSPCDGRLGQEVELRRDGRRNGSRFLSRACTARFTPRVRRGTTFVAAIRESSRFLAAESRPLTVKPAQRHRRH